jgi:hypothetical protein
VRAVEAAVCGSAHGIACAQCVRHQCVVVFLVVYCSAHGSVCGYPAVCGSARQGAAVCGSVRQCAAVCGSVWQCAAVRQCVAVRAAVCAAVCGSVWQCVLHIYSKSLTILILICPYRGSGN